MARHGLTTTVALLVRHNPPTPHPHLTLTVVTSLLLAVLILNPVELLLFVSVFTDCVEQTLRNVSNTLIGAVANKQLNGGRGMEDMEYPAAKEGLEALPG